MPLNTISDDDFSRLVKFIHGQYGIDLSQKRQLVTSRLSSLLSQKGYTDFGPFVSELLRKQDPADLELVLNRLTTNYTFFMREQEHFQFFEKVVLPEMIRRHQRDKVLAIWSAGCSSGEEPYNISIYIKEFLGAQASQWDTRILATDISQKALSAAKKGVYELPDTVPEVWRKKYFKKLEGSQYAVSPEIRNNVIFQTFNLMDPIRFRTKFDVIFCRNVMIYFDDKTKQQLVQKVYDVMKPGGYLFIGTTETIDRSVTPFEIVQPSIFRKKEG